MSRDVCLRFKSESNPADFHWGFGFRTRSVSTVHALELVFSVRNQNITSKATLSENGEIAEYFNSRDSGSVITVFGILGSIVMSLRGDPELRS
ncbi:hypothetical protein TWF217_003975 [Orbilia oligospora]|nr:hypothetical protein TWF751_004315 [Orbilia oligospora]KAF3272171.1 hypothetical protein TWF217_003975 [Orbilia oligospora]